MDPQRLKEAYLRLDLLDERLTYKVRPKPGGGMVRATADQLESQMRDLAEYTIELKEIVRELFLGLASRPQK
ncbi:MAG: hypothetical protein AAGD38_07050 [Acidobacteriota bacterium]